MAKEPRCKQSNRRKPPADFLFGSAPKIQPEIISFSDIAEKIQGKKALKLTPEYWQKLNNRRDCKMQFHHFSVLAVKADSLTQKDKKFFIINTTERTLTAYINQYLVLDKGMLYVYTDDTFKTMFYSKQKEAENGSLH